MKKARLNKRISESSEVLDLFGLAVPEFQSGEYKYNDPEFEPWDYVVAHGFTSIYHLYRGSLEACQILSCVMQEPYDIEMLCGIPFTEGSSSTEVYFQRERLQISKDQESNLVFLTDSRILRPDAPCLKFIPNKGYPGNTWVAAFAKDVTEEGLAIVEQSIQDYLNWLDESDN